VGLGQSYTERSRKLSDLIRWGSEQARVTLILDNRKQGGRRPVAKYSKDQLFLTRTLRRDGKYWFELENRAAGKQDIDRLLGRFGVDPDNMLIIMHQNMVEQFSVLSNIEKLRMVEAAVGLEPFRENVLQAKAKLTKILSQEESVSKLLESAEQTLNYWREQYEKYQEKKQLQLKRRFLYRELAWAEVERRENALKVLQASLQKNQDSLNKIENEKLVYTKKINDQQSSIENFRAQEKAIFNERLSLERDIAGAESKNSFISELLKETQILETVIQNKSQFKLLRTENLKEILKTSKKQLENINQQIIALEGKLADLEDTQSKVKNEVLDRRVNLSLLEYKRANAIVNLKEIEASLNESQSLLKTATTKAQKYGERIAAIKNTSEIQDEIRLTEGHLAALANISEDIERMYESY